MNVAVQLTNQELEVRTLTIPQQAKALEIRTSEDAQRASEIYGQIKAMRKEIDASLIQIFRKPMNCISKHWLKKRR